MIANGHSWSSIKSYSLSEIGLFFKVIAFTEKEKRIEGISQTWMGTHLTQKGFNDILKGSRRPVSKPQPSTKEVNKEWSRLKTFMSGVK